MRVIQLLTVLFVATLVSNAQSQARHRPPTTGWWCDPTFNGGEPITAECYRERRECLAPQTADRDNESVEHRACFQQTQAVCFMRGYRFGGPLQPSCFATLEFCQFALEGAVADHQDVTNCATFH